MAGEDDTFGDDPIDVRWEAGASADELEAGVAAVGSGMSFEEEYRDRPPRDRTNERSYRGSAGVQMSIVFMDVVGSLTTLREQGADNEPSRTALHYELILGLDRMRIACVERDADVDHGMLVFVPE